MKNNSSKTKFVILALLIAAWQAIAWVLIALIIVLVIVAGIVVYELYHTAKTHLYGDHADASRIWIDDLFGGKYYDLAYTSIGTNDWAFPSGSSYDMSGFTISYGLTNVAWLAVGELPQALISDISNIQMDDSGNVSYTMTATMQGRIVQLYRTPLGWTSVVLAEDTNLYDAVIERSVDLENWSPVVTNQILRWSVDSWTDTDAPADRAFYRIRL